MPRGRLRNLRDRGDRRRCGSSRLDTERGGAGLKRIHDGLCFTLPLAAAGPRSVEAEETELMSPQASSRSYQTEIHPRNCWYAVATSEELGREPLGRRVLGTGVVLFRTTDRTAVALEDRCAHRPYP